MKSAKFKPVRTEAMNLDDDEQSSTVTFTLLKNRKVDFELRNVAANDVEYETFVDKDNIRIGEELTPASLKVIVESIRFQQFQPAIAQIIDGRLSILDGSRRRASALIAKVGLQVLATAERLTKAEIKDLIKQLQSAEKHSARDQGRYFQSILDSNDENDDSEVKISIQDIAEREGCSKAHISKCLKAWGVPKELVLLFPIPRDISQKQFTLLANVAKKFDTPKKLSKFVSEIDISEGTSNIEAADFIEEHANFAKTTPVKFSPIVKLKENKWVKAKTVGDKRTIELRRIDKDKLEQIDNFIIELLKES